MRETEPPRPPAPAPRPEPSPEPSPEPRDRVQLGRSEDGDAPRDDRRDVDGLIRGLGDWAGHENAPTPPDAPRGRSVDEIPRVGRVVTRNDGDQVTVTRPGTRERWDLESGTYQSRSSEGVETVHPDGRRVERASDGTVRTTSPDGSTVERAADGSTTRTFSREDGSEVTTSRTERRGATILQREVVGANGDTTKVVRTQRGDVTEVTRSHTTSVDGDIEDLAGSEAGQVWSDGVPGAGYSEPEYGTAAEGDRGAVEKTTTSKVVIGPGGERTRVSDSTSYRQTVEDADLGLVAERPLDEVSSSRQMLASTQTTTYGPDGAAQTEQRIETRNEQSGNAFGHDGTRTKVNAVTFRDGAPVTWEQQLDRRGMDSADGFSLPGSYLDKLPEGPLDRRVTKTYSYEGDFPGFPTTRYEIGNYASPDQDGTTVSYEQNPEGTIGQVGVRTVSQNGGRVQNQVSAYGSDAYEYTDTRLRDDGTYTSRGRAYDENGDLARRWTQSRERVQPSDLPPGSRYHDDFLTGQDGALYEDRLQVHDVESDTTTRTRQFWNPRDDRTLTHVTETEGTGDPVRSTAYHDPSGRRPLRVHSDGPGGGEFAVGPEGQVMVDGKQVGALDQALRGTSGSKAFVTLYSNLRKFRGGDGLPPGVGVGVNGLDTAIKTLGLSQAVSSGQTQDVIAAGGDVSAALGKTLLSGSKLGAVTETENLGRALRVTGTPLTVAGGGVGIYAGITEIRDGEEVKGALTITGSASGTFAALAGGTRLASLVPGAGLLSAATSIVTNVLYAREANSVSDPVF